MSWTYTAFSDGTKASAESVMGNFYNARHGNLLPRDPSTGAASTATATSLSGWNRIYSNKVAVSDTTTAAKNDIFISTTGTMTIGNRKASFWTNHADYGVTPVYTAVLLGTSSGFTSTFEYELSAIHPSCTAERILDVEWFYRNTINFVYPGRYTYAELYRISWDSTKITVTPGFIAPDIYCGIRVLMV